MNPDWIVPDWPAPVSVRAVFTTRHGGRSQAPFDSLNLGDHVGDAAPDVSGNRAALHARIGARPIFLKQVHGRDVAVLDADMVDGYCADACITVERGIACTIMVADCLPVLLTTEDGSVVAAAHAGWRGLAGAGEMAGTGVLERLLQVFYERFSSPAQSIRAEAAIKIIAWLGPCIGPSAFEVGAEVRAAFEQDQPGAARFFTSAPGESSSELLGKSPNTSTVESTRESAGGSAIESADESTNDSADESAVEPTHKSSGQASDQASGKASGKASGNASGKYHADLAGLARLRLQALGIHAIYGNDSSPEWCTVSNPSRFFSHRRDTAVSAGGRLGANVMSTGRMAACIWRV